jgi:hypothetical protein
MQQPSSIQLPAAYHGQYKHRSYHNFDVALHPDFNVLTSRKPTISRTPTNHMGRFRTSRNHTKPCLPLIKKTPGGRSKIYRQKAGGLPNRVDSWLHQDFIQAQCMRYSAWQFVGFIHLEQHPAKMASDEPRIHVRLQKAEPQHPRLRLCDPGCYFRALELTLVAMSHHPANPHALAT